MFKIGDMIWGKNGENARVEKELDESKYIIRSIESKFQEGDEVYIKCRVVPLNSGFFKMPPCWKISKKNGKQLYVTLPIDLWDFETCQDHVSEKNFFTVDDIKKNRK